MYLFALLSIAVAYAQPNEAALRKQLASGRRHLQLPRGVVEIGSELVVPEGLTLRGHPSGSELRAAAGFRGRALLVCRSGVTLAGFSIDGNREALAKPLGVPHYDRTFISFFPSNAVLVEEANRVRIQQLRFRRVANFAVLIYRSQQVFIDRVSVSSSGSLDSKGRNNTTGGILLEEGTVDFAVRNSTFRQIRGNAVWTHSREKSPRNKRGSITGNRFYEIGRDAIQVGHSTEIRVENNRGERIGFPSSVVDIEGGATPVAIDTAGNVDSSLYASNFFSEINGKCIDLDGFHDGEVRGNTCVNRQGASAYPYGNFGIVFNNTNKGMQSRNVRVIDNVIDGSKFGGMFVIGSGHTILGNRMSRLNLAGCNESTAQYGCLYDSTQPDLLQTGIYLAARAERAADTRGNTIEDNLIAGHKMAERCIGPAPGVVLQEQNIRRNTCKNQ